MSGLTGVECASVEYHELLLERLKVAAVGAFTRRSLHLETYESAQDFMLDRLSVRLTGEVLAERVLDTEVVVPWSGSADHWVEPRDSRGLGWPFAVAAGLGLLTPVLGVGMLLAALAVALLALCLLSLNPPTEGHFEEVIVGGSITVPATYWRKFPEINQVYPENIGTPIRFVQLGSPAFSQGGNPE